DSLEFQFDVDLGERWPTNFDPGNESSAEGELAARKGSPSADLVASPALARIRPLELPEASGDPSVATRSTWWTKTDATGTHVRLSHVLLSAAAFATLSGGVSWFLVR